MPFTNLLESIKNNETDQAEGGLFLCESDLISSFFSSQCGGNAQPAPVHTPDVSSALLSLKAQLAVAAY